MSKIEAGMVIVAVLSFVTLVWFAQKNRPRQFRDVALPGEIGTISLPSTLASQTEDDTTLMAFPEDENVILRFSSISFVPKETGKEQARVFVAESASKRNHRYFEVGDKSVEAFEEATSQNGVPVVVKFWTVGAKNTVVMVSATIERDKLNDSSVKRTLQEIPRILATLDITISHHIIEKEGKKIEVTTQTVAATPQVIKPFGTSEHSWLVRSEGQARSLSLKYGSGGVLDPDELDRIFWRWSLERDGAESPDIISSALGAAFGNYLVDEHGFKWVVVGDEFGSECAVRHRIGATMAFPRASVQKPIDNGESEFFSSLYLGIVEHLEQSETESQPRRTNRIGDANP